MPQTVTQLHRENLNFLPNWDAPEFDRERIQN